MTNKDLLKDYLKKLIIYSAEEFINESDVSEDEICLIDTFADFILQQVDTIQFLKENK